jgi:hypothetical protein
MLVLRRKSGQWVDVLHRSGDLLRIRVYDISGEFPGRANLAFEDPARNFEINRPDRAPLRESGRDELDLVVPISTTIRGESGR